MAEANYTPRLRTHYDSVVRPAMIEQFGYKNPMQVPTIEKIVINMGVGEATADTKKATTAAADLALIAGQKPVLTRARKAISNFKRCARTSRLARRSPFARRACTSSLTASSPCAAARVRDFRGLNPKSFDGRGNYAMGIKEHIVFPENQL